MFDSFINYRRYKHAKLAFLLSLVAIAVYIWHDPLYPPNGGTWFGYTLGGISFLLVLWLMYFGIKKRRYASGRANLQAWLSAHVYLGLALIVFVTLHTGFQFGWNIHTLAYGLLVLEVISGLYGVYAYLRYPRLLTDNMDNQTRSVLLDSITQIDQECTDVAINIGGRAPDAIRQLIASMAMGGGVMEQLKPDLKQSSVPVEISQLFDQIKDEERRDQLSDMMKTNNFSQASFAQGEQYKTGQMHELLDLLARRKELVSRVRRDISYKARLEIWLYIHVPLAFAVLAAVIVHIVSVFMYW